MHKARIALMVLVIASLGLQSSDDPPASAPDVNTRVASAFHNLVESESDWRAAQAASDELAAIGEPALDAVLRGAEHENARVRLACVRLLATIYAGNQRAMQALANLGLADADSAIRYVSAFGLGEHKFHAAHLRLRQELDDPENDDLTRYAAAKSLAELGEADVLRTLYLAIESDWYMERYMGNLGLKGLTGKDLNDFESYDFSEGAFVSGGYESVPMFDAVAQSEKRAKRYSAMAAFFRWLQAEKPEMYKHVTGTF